MKILIDNGHGQNTPGKRSPDRSFYEWKFNREIAIPVVEELRRRGYDAERIVTEDAYDVSLQERCNRVNAWCNRLGKQNVLLVSIHANAAGNGDWRTARGFSVFVAKQSSAASKKLAQSLYAEAEKRGLKGNRSVPSVRYWEANFTIIARTNCPAVLTENLFYDNKEDLAILKSEEGKKKIVDLHVEGIISYINSQL
jgi:N-acetylmuramoyl-L-alanine amidase